MFDLQDFSDHEEVVMHYDKKSGLQAIIAIHNTNLGPALGGCRMFPYSSSQDALEDVLRLSSGMTYKAALANLPQGGGKAVIIGDPRAAKSDAMMHALGRLVQSLDGRYIIAEDSGISVNDIQRAGTQTQFVGGVQAKFDYLGGEADGNPAIATAYGVFNAIKASVAFHMGDDLAGKKIAIKGLGQVGYRLAEHLHRAGAELFVSDVYPHALQQAQSKLNAQVVDNEHIDTLDVDVFAPCALGKAIHANNVDKIKARVIAGAANNQLASSDLGERLHQRGILYAPDYVANAGGIIDIYHQSIDSTPAALKQHLEDIGQTLRNIFEISQAESQSTARVADRMAEHKFSLQD